MNQRSRSTLFLMEQLIVVATFALCAAACIKILTASYFMAIETRNTNNAIRAAESSAECYKAVSGDIGKTAEMMGGAKETVGASGAAVVYYDKDWNACAEKDAAFLLRIVDGSPAGRTSGLAVGSLSVEKITGEEILAFSLAAGAGGVTDE